VLRAGVVVLEVVFDALLELGEVVDDLVSTSIALVSKHVIAEDDTFAVQNLRLRDLEEFLSLSENEF
jgi:hypothetical protein